MRKSPADDECEEFVYREYDHRNSTCGRKSVGVHDGQRECKMHQSVRLRREARSAERREKWDREARERDESRAAAARLTNVGVKAKSTWSGSVTLTIEAAIDLAERLEALGT